MRVAEILVDDDLVHEIFIAAPRRSRMFDDGEESLSGRRAGPIAMGPTGDLLIAGYRELWDALDCGATQRGSQNLVIVHNIV